jgi:toluene monooxygenase system ferredoxin subunit
MRHESSNWRHSRGSRGDDRERAGGDLRAHPVEPLRLQTRCPGLANQTRCPSHERCDGQRGARQGGERPKGFRETYRNVPSTSEDVGSRRRCISPCARVVGARVSAHGLRGTVSGCRRSRDDGRRRSEGCSSCDPSAIAAQRCPMHVQYDGRVSTNGLNGRSGWTVRDQLMWRSSTMPENASTAEWVAIATLDDLWGGEMTDVRVGDDLILLVPSARRRHPEVSRILSPPEDPARGWENGRLHPHLRSPLVAVRVSMGEGVNPNSCRLDRYDLKIEDAAIWVCFRQSILGSFSVSSTYLRPSSPERCRRTKFQWISIKRHAAATALLNVSRVIVSKDNEQRHTRSPATRSSQLPCHCHRPHWMS